MCSFVDDVHCLNQIRDQVTIILVVVVVGCCCFFFVVTFSCVSYSLIALCHIESRNLGFAVVEQYYSPCPHYDLL